MPIKKIIHDCHVGERRQRLLRNAALDKATIPQPGENKKMGKTKFLPPGVDDRYLIYFAQGLETGSFNWDFQFIPKW